MGNDNDRWAAWRDEMSHLPANPGPPPAEPSKTTKCLICGRVCARGTYDGSLPHLYNGRGEQMEQGDALLFNTNGTIHYCAGDD